MREILFRGKRRDNLEWMEGCFLIDYITGQYFIHAQGNSVNESDGVGEEGCVSFQAFEVFPDTVCQYTGLTDRNGEKIFEGDIVKCGGNLVVTWNEKFAGWCLTKKGWAYKHFFGEACEPKDCEVIGNIFDNLGLIGGAG
ncbi:MAG: YopX family protein [Lachnospiraceae bacterium]|nr:YopX family protein [Lachnospiraceae bacterium]MCM1240461.1 YopX family protein [Lachnospiraceae bacterium]